MTMIGAGPLRYRWNELDATGFGDDGQWVHPGLAVLSDESLVGFDETARELFRIDEAGTAGARTAAPVEVVHGVSVEQRGGDDILWIADPGIKDRVVDGRHERRTYEGRVVAMADGDVVDALDPPDHPAYRDTPYRPTSVAVEAGRWVADGYGASLVHRYGSDGAYLATLNGEEGPGRFQTPHAVDIDDRGAGPRLLIADRGNALVHAYDLDGRYLRSFGAGDLSSPSAFAIAGPFLVVAELRARLAVFDPDDVFVGYLGDGGSVWEEEGWPNVSQDGRIVPRRQRRPGRFDSPHGIAAAADGTIHVAEWCLGGRLVRLDPVAA